MKKIVINRCYGGFNLSYAQQVLLEVDSPYAEVDRLSPLLVDSVEAGDIGGSYANLYVVSIPEEAHYFILEHDGFETLYWSLSELHVE